MNKMVARKTIVSLVWNLLIGWAVWIIVNFIEKTVSARCPGHFYWKNMLSQEYIDILWDELNNTDFYFLKKFSTVPRALLLKLLPGVDVLLLHLLVLHDLVLPAVVGHQLHLG